MWAAAAASVGALYALQLQSSPAAQAQRQLLAAHQRREVDRIKAMPRPKLECEGCGAADFDHRGCTYCRRPRLDPARLQTSAGIGAMYGFATVRPELLLGGDMLVSSEDGR